MSEKNEYPWLSEDLTPWRNINEDPELAGVYELKDSSFPYSFWCGEEFHGAWSSVEQAFAEKDYTDETRLSGSAINATGWRGLAKEPK